MKAARAGAIVLGTFVVIAVVAIPVASRVRCDVKQRLRKAYEKDLRVAANDRMPGGSLRANVREVVEHAVDGGCSSGLMRFCQDCELHVLNNASDDTSRSLCSIVSTMFLDDLLKRSKFKEVVELMETCPGYCAEGTPVCGGMIASFGNDGVIMMGALADEAKAGSVHDYFVAACSAVLAMEAGESGVKHDKSSYRELMASWVKAHGDEYEANVSYIEDWFEWNESRSTVPPPLMIKRVPRAPD